MLKVSVCIPVYNQEELVLKCLDSIPKRKDIEIIVVNDGSTDNTLEELKRYKEEEYNSLRIIAYPKNKGVSYARNEAIEYSKGEYILFIDSDDYIYPKIFNRIVDKCLYADIVYYNMENNYGKIYDVDESKCKTRVGMFKFIKKDFIGDIRFPLNVQYGEDRVFTLALLEKPHNAFYTGLTMYHYNYPRVGSLSYVGERKDK